ncbi:hypothetical protein ACFU5O_24945 [Streptomyces sp. NPDC057445]|uniref:hypothetical protein n=1 Tax=Streptomyces sp. NPDC057445 TaxID=3346136 RepID=UPI003683751A
MFAPYFGVSRASAFACYGEGDGVLLPGCLDPVQQDRRPHREGVVGLVPANVLPVLSPWLATNVSH